MATVLLVGAGAVGVRAARQLLDTPHVERLLVADRHGRRARSMADSGGSRVEAVRLSTSDPIPPGVDVVAAAVPPGLDSAYAKQAIDAGVPFASAGDDADAISELGRLHGSALAAGVVLAAGCGLAPGLSDVLAQHAAGALDRVDEVHVSRAGAAGPACVSSVRRARREEPREWYEGVWRPVRRRGPELSWFPDPVGARDCELVSSGTDLLVEAFPHASRLSVRFSEPPVRRRWSVPGRHTLDEEWGAARVEVWGVRGQAREPIVYGVIERTAVAAGTVLAVAAATLAGLMPSAGVRSDVGGGTHGLGVLVETTPFLAELARRGVKAAVFEGVAVA